MTDKPILFSGPMVSALLDGRKTQTRRLFRMPKVPEFVPPWPAPHTVTKDLGFHICRWHSGFRHDVPDAVRVGDRLWVRESHYAWGHWETTTELTKTGKRKRKFVREPDCGEKFRPVIFDSDAHTITNGMPERQHGIYSRLGRFMFRADSRPTEPKPKG